MREQIIRGKLAIVRLGEVYEVVSSDVAEKIIVRHIASVIVDNEHLAIDVKKEDDPYANYQIPDDLIW